MQTDILIIGGGLSGLSLAAQLQAQGRDYHLIEARDRLGGRIEAHTIKTKSGHVSYDMGPAWFWPGQPRMATLIDSLGLDAFAQYSRGALSYEDATGPAQRGRGYASMEGSYRLNGSFAKLIKALATKLPLEHISTGQRAINIDKTHGLTTTVKMSGGETRTIKSKKIILALPPRVAADAITYTPTLTPGQIQAMRNIPTWMAGHAKITAVYERPFWRDAGLSGDAMSRRGPMVEIHDASPAEDGPYALFGFVGVPANAREGQRDGLLSAAKTQLIRLFGDAANNPLDLVLKDWAFEAETATQLDQAGPSHHPDYRLPAKLENIWDGQLILASTETAPQFGGFLEGALEAAEITFNKLTHTQDTFSRTA